MKDKKTLESIKKLNFKDLKQDQEEGIRGILNRLVLNAVKSLDSITEDRKEIKMGCMCGQCSPMLNIDEITTEIRSLTHRGLDYIDMHISAIFLMEELRSDTSKKQPINTFRQKISLVLSLLFILIALPAQIYESVQTEVAASIFIPLMASLMYVFRAVNTWLDFKFKKGYYIIIPDIVGICILSVMFMQYFSIDVWGFLSFLK